MIDVLVYVYENFWDMQACPQAPQLHQRLRSVGFEAEEIDGALHWLDTLRQCVDPAQSDASPDSLGMPSMRLFVEDEQERLGAQGLGLIRTLEIEGVLPAELRERVMDQAMALGQGPLDLDDLKIMVLMACWSSGMTPDRRLLAALGQDPMRCPVH